MTAVRTPVVVLALLLSACCSEEVPSTDAYLGVMERRLVRLGGRPFSLTVIEPTSPTGFAVSGRILSIVGDGRHISFHVSGSSGAPTTSADTLEYGGHSFAATPVPGEYVVDGSAVSLGSETRVVHVFSDGAYHGTRPF